MASRRPGVHFGGSGHLGWVLVWDVRECGRIVGQRTLLPGPAQPVGDVDERMFIIPPYGAFHILGYQSIRTIGSQLLWAWWTSRMAPSFMRCVRSYRLGMY